MRERHADTVRFHKSHRPKMTVVRLVIGLLLLVFPTQLTAVSETMGFSYVLSYIGSVYHNIYFTLNEDGATEQTSVPVVDSVTGTKLANFFMHIETNDSQMQYVSLEFSSFGDGTSGVQGDGTPGVHYDVQWRNVSDSGYAKTWNKELSGGTSYSLGNYLSNDAGYEIYTSSVTGRGDDHYLFQMQIFPYEEDLNAFPAETNLSMTITVTGEGA